MKTYSKNNLRMCSIKKCSYLAKFIGKHLCQSLFFIKVASLRAATLLKRDLGKSVFGEFCEVFKNTFFAEHHRVAASDIRMQVVVIYNLNLSLQVCNNRLYIYSSARFHAGA